MARPPEQNRFFGTGAPKPPTLEHIIQRVAEQEQYVTVRSLGGEMSGGYSKERGQPSSGVCRQTQGPYWLLFDGNFLNMQYGSNAIQRWEARSGGKVRKGSFDYSVANQKRQNLGPIPAGEYWIDPSELASQPGPYEFWRKEWPLEGWGKYRITVHPRPSTDTYGRGGMFIHGGSSWGSAGCIDLTWGIGSFAHAIRGLKNCHIPLTVRYRVELVGDPP